jgi:hypothetical protein
MKEKEKKKKKEREEKKKKTSLFTVPGIIITPSYLRVPARVSAGRRLQYFLDLPSRHSILLRVLMRACV